MTIRSIVSARRAAAIAAIAAATAVAGCGSSDSTSTANASGGEQSTQTQGGPPGQGGPGAMFDTAALAEKLGVTEAKLQAAMEKAMPERPDGAGNGERPTTPPQGADGTPPTSPQGGGQGGPGGGRMTEMFATIADELGLSESKVQKAFESVMPQGGPGGQPGGTDSSSSSGSQS